MFQISRPALSLPGEIDNLHRINTRYLSTIHQTHRKRVSPLGGQGAVKTRIERDISGFSKIPSKKHRTSVVFLNSWPFCPISYSIPSPIAPIKQNSCFFRHRHLILYAECNFNLSYESAKRSQISVSIKLLPDYKFGSLMNKHTLITILTAFLGVFYFCTEPLNPLSIDSNTGIAPADLSESVFVIGDTVPFTIALRLPHFIDHIEFSLNEIDSTIQCSYSERYADTLRFQRVFEVPDTISISYKAVFTNGRTLTEVDTLVIRGFPAQVEKQQTRVYYLSDNASCTLSVNASGSQPLNYQWYKNSEKLDGKTGYTYIIPSFLESDTGIYTCKVTNPWGEDESTPAVIVYRQLSGKTTYWNFTTFTDSLHEGETLLISLEKLFTTDGVAPVEMERLALEDKCEFRGDSLFVFHAGTRDSGSYVIPASVISGTSGDTASFIINVKPTWCTITTKSDSGYLTMDPEHDKYRWGDTVFLEAVAYEGYTFFEWDGDLSGNNARQKVVVTRDLSVTARFWPETHAVCNTVDDGRLNRIIRESSPAEMRPTLLCPKPGFYDEGSIRIHGKVRFIIQ